MTFIPRNTRKLIASHPLTRHQRFRAYGRFAQWQIRSRLVRSYVTHEWISDSKFLVKRGESGLTGNVYFGLHEFNDMGFLLHLLRPGDTFIDVGANLGSYSILAGKAVGVRGVAFEPVPSAFIRLCENLEINGITSAFEARNLAIGAHLGVVQFSSTSDTTNHVLAHGEKRHDAIEVPVSTLDVELRDQHPTLVKIDVEGYEHSVLKGAEQTLQRKSLKALIIEIDSTNRYGSDAAFALSALSKEGFKPYVYDPITRQLQEITAFKHDAPNTIFVRDLEWAQRRVREAQSYSVLGAEI